MHPIHEYHQSKFIGNDATFPAAVSLFGKSSANTAVGIGRLAKDVESGRWDTEINTPGIGPDGRSLLLTFLGSRWSRLVSEFGQQAPDENVAPLARAMVARGADPLEKDNEGRDCLDQAVAIGEDSLIVEWVSRMPNPADIMERQMGGGPQNQPKLPWLHQAARSGHAPMVQALLEAGFEANHVNEHGQTALFWAANPVIVSILLNAGCDPFHRDALNQDARLFWASHRRIPQASIAPMAAALPRPVAGKVSRSQLVADFYRQAFTSGKGALAPALAKIRIQPGECDSQGFGLLGNLGSRLLDASSSRSGNDVSKSVNWASHLVEDPAIRASATRSDWVRLWVGACRFGLSRLGLAEKIEGEQWRFDPDFYREALEHATLVAPNLQGLHARDMMLAMSRDLRRVAERSDKENAPLLAEISARCLLEAGLRQGKNNASPFAREQEDFMTWMVNNPRMGLEQTPTMWAVALCVDSSQQTLTSGIHRLHVPLVKLLADCRTPLPADIQSLLGEAMQALNGEDVGVLADVQAQLLADQTTPSSKTSSRHRL